MVVDYRLRHVEAVVPGKLRTEREIDVLVIGWIIDRVEATQFDKLISPENQARCRYVIDSGQGRQLTLRVKMAVVAQDNVTVFG